jgi:D-tyrosyl-tRNA(Tyr) deacylase
VRAVVQRVQRARVVVRGETVGAIGPGLCVLLGVAGDDSEGDAERLAAKTAHLRIFENEAGKFDLSLLDIQGEVLVVSQFTLIADTTKGQPTELRPRRPAGERGTTLRRFSRRAERVRSPRGNGRLRRADGA